MGNETNKPVTMGEQKFGNIRQILLTAFPCFSEMQIKMK